MHSFIPRWEVARYPDFPKAPFPTCFTPLALDILLLTVGRKYPESGSKAFSPADVLGIEVVEHDRNGSARAGGAIYSPDADWGDRRCTFHLRTSGKPRLWSSDIHSHPGNMGRPSAAAGRGLGDLGYVAEFFHYNEWAEWFLLPILTGTGPHSPRITIHPWAVKRGRADQPVQLFITDVRVCSVSRFPRRAFNPDWERSLTKGHA